MNFTAFDSRLVNAISSSRGSPTAAQSRFDDEFDLTAGIGLRQAGGDTPRRGCKIDGNELHLGPRDARKLQQVVNQQSHALRFGTDPIEVLVRPFVELAGIVFGKCEAPAVDAAQRRAQVVRDRIGKRFQFLVGGFELSGALTNPLFQLGVELADLLFRLLSASSGPVRTPRGTRVRRPILDSPSGRPAPGSRCRLSRWCSDSNADVPVPVGDRNGIPQGGQGGRREELADRTAASSGHRVAALPGERFVDRLEGAGGRIA